MGFNAVSTKLNWNFIIQNGGLTREFYMDHTREQRQPGVS